MGYTPSYMWNIPTSMRNDTVIIGYIYIYYAYGLLTTDLIRVIHMQLWNGLCLCSVKGPTWPNPNQESSCDTASGMWFHSHVTIGTQVYGHLTAVTEQLA